MYAQGMTFGGDLGLVVASSLGKARAVLVCTVPVQGLCSHCIQPIHTQSSGELFADKLLSSILKEVNTYSWLKGHFEFFKVDTYLLIIPRLI